MARANTHSTRRTLFADDFPHCCHSLTKRKYLQAELGEGTLALMRTVKRALDPLNLLNPGKVLFDEEENL